MIEYWGLLPNGKRVSTKRHENGAMLTHIACYQEIIEGETVWCHRFARSEKSARAVLAQSIRYRDRRMMQDGHDITKMRSEVMPVYFLVKV